MSDETKRAFDVHAETFEFVAELALAVGKADYLREHWARLQTLMRKYDPALVAMAFLGHAAGLAQLAAAEGDTSLEEIIGLFREHGIWVRLEVDSRLPDDDR